MLVIYLYDKVVKIRDRRKIQEFQILKRKILILGKLCRLAIHYYVAINTSRTMS